ncbi:hypothetical protein [Prevotella nigrescens]|jgi:hypothetical protein|uniref:hypothetical protein n=1 Tax=Prevotella nigrescens TaxID=28133 RepID=UPI000B4C5A53|nr:hypothetical protein [Prevotella nigrescens]OWP28930.1 hypothetical protein CBG57_11155 [Prevotella nigrescens]
MYQKIEKWIDKVLQQDFPDDVVAVMFNLYEDGDALYSMEVVGTESFDEEDEDWACDELTDFETRENPLVLKSKSDWEEMLSTVSGCLKRYLSEGKHADKLKGCTAVATGFVDGDIEILYTKA